VQQISECIRRLVVQFDKEASQTRDSCVAKYATLRAARPDPSLRKVRLLGMTNQTQPLPPGRRYWETSCQFPVLSSQNGLQRRQELAHALQSAVEFRFRRGIRNTDVLASSKALAGHGGHVRVAQKFSCQARS